MDASRAPHRLRDVGVTEDSLELLASDAMKQTRLLGNNPIEMTEAEAIQIDPQRIVMPGFPALSKSPMTLKLYISSACGEDCPVLMAKALRGIEVSARHPIRQRQIADTGRSELQDVADNIKDTASCQIELEQRQHGPPLLSQGDDGIVAGHGLHGAFRILRFDAQQRAGLCRID